jgi:general L-amino acid transport system permease protein
MTLASESVTNAAAKPSTYVRKEPAPELPPPLLASGWIAWFRNNLFSSIPNTLLTLLGLYAIYLIALPVVNFLFVDAVWTGSNRDACLAANVGRPVGSCWPFITNRIGYYVYGQYPLSERWRVNLTFLMAAVGIAWMLWPRAPQRVWGAAYFFLVFPVSAFFLLLGARWLGLPPVSTNLWGGVLVTMVLSLIGIVFSLPFGILLALGRRSRLPFVRFASVVFIEFVRGVPLITVLFMSNRMLPLFLSQGMQPDALLRVIIGIAMFSAAYMAEVVRGGLQAMPRGQYEGAQSLGLGYWQMMGLIILPQALKLVIPGIVNTFIGLFKDTSLVTIVGIFDFLTTVQVSMNDPNWATPVTSLTGYAFAALFYFVCCYAMALYSQGMERRLAKTDKR